MLDLTPYLTLNIACSYKLTISTLRFRVQLKVKKWSNHTSGDVVYHFRYCVIFLDFRQQFRRAIDPSI